MPYRFGYKDRNPRIGRRLRMARITVEDCLENVENRFQLVLLATKRAKQLLKGSRPLLESDNKEVVTALREIGAGKVKMVVEAKTPAAAGPAS